MSGCLSSSMTGSTDAGPLQPQEDPVPPSTYDFRPLSEGDGSTSARRGCRHHRHQPRRRMTSAPPSGQTIQLTPLWEHVVRTRRFPSEIDTQATFVEISERLRDPEWEVRQHALRVLMDVLPTLNADAVDKVMQPVVPELINNLGHPAPAVRKGALDALRVYLVHTPNKDSVVKNILHDGLNRPDAHNPFQTNVTTGVILSAPLLLFPSSDSPPPTTQILKDATIAFAARLVQVPHQEAVLKSLMKIRDEVGDEEFESYLADYDDKLKKNIDVLSKIYNIKPSKRKRERGYRARDIVKADTKERILDKSWDSDSDTSGIAEEEDETSSAIPPARVVLETEIKFNEETAITMTILEEKDEDESGDEGTGKGENSSSADKRKTPRRVRFGGEIVKLRTPDSDETESIEITPKTRIPLPVSPATKMPETTSRRRPSSQPCSPHAGEKRRSRRRISRSASSSPKREYTHNAQLSPKKSILTRTDGPLIDPITEETKRIKKDRRSSEAVSEEKGSSKVNNSAKEGNETSRKEETILAQTTLCSANKEEKLTKNKENNRAKDENNVSKTAQVAIAAAPKNASSKGEQAILEENHTIDESVFKTISRREKNLSPTKLSNPSGPKTIEESRDDSLEMERGRSNEDVRRASEGNFVRDFSNNLPFGSPVNGECEARIDRLIGGDFVDDDEREDARIFDDRATKYDDGEVSVRNDEGHKGRGGQCSGDRKSASEGNGSVTCSSSEGEGKPREPSWEELGLVGQEVLDDLHNKDDWRARVRGLERIASALRTSSALIAIESRLGSLLHAVLGGERSCRVAAAGFAVAKVVVAGVSEDALRKRLPQLAWGLARQGGPAAAQLARIAMLRLKPSLLLDQLLQPHCLSARNAKTRENALQLLIFSLVTFPSTEFKLETVASRVAAMVADRRRRVRQAALDALAVLGQIYDSEEVLEAGRRAADGHADAEAMLAAVRARLARKSLPLVSADGLVVYGLQISSTVQIATGPDVDWIVAGSGSVSPGTGRTRGQIIATSRSAQGRASRNESTNNRENSWMERPNLVALGVGLQSKTEQSTAWQILPSQTNNDNGNEIKGSNGRNVNAGVFSNVSLRFEEQLRSSYTNLTSNQYDFVETDAKNHREIFDNNFEQKARNRKNVNEVAKEKESTALRGESKIPILLSTRERPKITSQNREKSINLEYVNSNSRKQTKDALDSNSNRINSRQENIRSYAAVYQRRKRLQQEGSQTLNQTFDSHCGSYRSSSYAKAPGTTNREYNSVAGNREAIFSNDNPHNYGRFVNDDFTDKNENSDRAGERKRLSRDMQQQTLVEMYSSIHERQRKLTDRTVYRRLRTAPNPLTCVYDESEHLVSQVSADNDRNMIYQSKDASEERKTEMDPASSDSQENERSSVENVNPHRRRLRSLSPSQLHRSRQFIKLASSRFHTASMYDIDKTVNEEEYNARNKRHLSPEAKNYQVQNSNKEESRYQEFLRSFSVGERAHVCPGSASSSSSEVSRSDRRKIDENQDAAAPRDYNGNSDNSGSSTPRSQDDDPAFDVITTNRQSVRDDVDSFFTPLDINKVEYPIEMANMPDEASKEWNSEDEAKPTNRIGSISRHSTHEELIAVNENRSESTESSCGAQQPEDVRSSARRRSIVTVIPNERVLPYEDPKIIKESLQTRVASPIKSESLYRSPENRSINNSPISEQSPAKRNSRCGSRNLAENPRDSSEERIIASIVPDEDASVQSLDTIARPPIDISMTGDSPAIIIASRPHSHETAENLENSRNEIHTQESTEEESSVNDTLEDRQSKDSTSETNTEPGILKIEPESVEAIESRRRIASKVPIRGIGRYRPPSNKKASPIEKPSLEKSKRMVQQCFTQLDNKDWEITMKGLKSLSHIAKQHPECLDTCATGTIGRLLGRHIKNLRSQVARAACLAASDIFNSQIRGIDQDLDDIAGPLLQRTADTNRFLRADSNAALDQMVQHLPPHKTISVIVLRGASHQNAIVRAATARLLSEIIDRIGPDHIMILPRDVRDKLLNTGAKLLMDGNLDARNHAKKMFRRLTRCEGFRKALTDAVPETTLRHIDKTMKTL